MGKEIITFGDIEVEKHKFHQRKSPISIYDLNFYRTVACNKILFSKIGFKYFTEYEDGSEKKMLLCIILPKMRAYGKKFDETKYMYFLINDNKLLEECNKIWNKVSKIV